MRAPLTGTLVAAGVLLSAGCQAGVPVGKFTPCADEPAWVSRGSGEFLSADGKAIFAVGVGAHEAKLDIRQEKARADARAKLTAQLEAYVAGLTNQLAHSCQGDFDSGPAAAHRFFQEAARPVAEAELMAAREMGWWQCPVTQELWVLMKVSEGQFLGAYRQQVHKLAQERGARLFQQRTQEVRRKCDAELEQSRLRRPRGYLGVRSVSSSR